MRTNGTLRAVLCCGITAGVLSACGTSDGATDTSLHNAVPPSSTSVQTTSVTDNVPAGQLAGYVLAWVDSGDLIIGSIDPETGEYSSISEFALGDFAIAGNAPTAADELHFRRLVAPDYRRAYAQRIVDGSPHVGWVDDNGTFTDVTLAVAGPRTDFGGEPNVRGHGFDLQGNFYYSTAGEREITVWKLPPGQTNGGTAVHSSADYLINPRIMVDGLLNFKNVGCVPKGKAGFLPDGYVWTDQTQVYRRSGVPANGTPGLLCDAEDVELLPDTNSSYVTTPVASDDGSRVAFVFEDRDGKKSIYSLNSVDGSDATETTVPKWPAENAALVDWIN